MAAVKPETVLILVAIGALGYFGYRAYNSARLATSDAFAYVGERATAAGNYVKAQAPNALPGVNPLTTSAFNAGAAVGNALIDIFGGDSIPGKDVDNGYNDGYTVNDMVYWN